MQPIKPSSFFHYRTLHHVLHDLSDPRTAQVFRSTKLVLRDSSSLEGFCMQETDKKGGVAVSRTVSGAVWHAAPMINFEDVGEQPGERSEALQQNSLLLDALEQYSNDRKEP